MKTWLKLAIRRDVVLRSVKIALVVGTLLAFINHYDRIMDGTWSFVMIAKIALTYLVPHSVSTVAAVGALRGEGPR